MKRRRQITDSHCGPAVIQMLYSNLGLDIKQRDIASAAGVKDKIFVYGTTIPEMMQAVASLTPDLTFWYKNLSTKEELDFVINKVKYPVGVGWQGIFYEYEDEDDGHYSVATGINIPEDIIYLADPFIIFAGRDRRIKLHAFLKRWWDVNEIVNPATKEVTHQADDQVMFVITPKDEVFPQTLGMKTTYSNP